MSKRHGARPGQTSLRDIEEVRPGRYMVPEYIVSGGGCPLHKRDRRWRLTGWSVNID